MAYFEENSSQEQCKNSLRHQRDLEQHEDLFKRCDCKWDMDQIESAFFHEYFFSLVDMKYD